jgi:hypothetical protein
MTMSYIHTHKQKYHILIVTETEHLELTSCRNFQRWSIVAKTDVLYSILTAMAMSYIHTRRQKDCIPS